MGSDGSQLGQSNWEQGAVEAVHWGFMAIGGEFAAERRRTWSVTLGVAAVLGLLGLGAVVSYRADKEKLRSSFHERFGAFERESSPSYRELREKLRELAETEEFQHLPSGSDVWMVREAGAAYLRTTRDVALGRRPLSVAVAAEPDALATCFVQGPRRQPQRERLGRELHSLWVDQGEDVGWRIHNEQRAALAAKLERPRPVISLHPALAITSFDRRFDERLIAASSPGALSSLSTEVHFLPWENALKSLSLGWVILVIEDEPSTVIKRGSDEKQSGLRGNGASTGREIRFGVLDPSGNFRIRLRAVGVERTGKSAVEIARAECQLAQELLWTWEDQAWE